ncbi:MAG: hypothetical protein DME38_13330 [Verrucomicrobia bacterium]|nr:MAG: hypothetical protein DME38_13330 [Verrucomicrobiota bacterium]
MGERISWRVLDFGLTPWFPRSLRSFGRCVEPAWDNWSDKGDDIRISGQITVGTRPGCVNRYLRTSRAIDDWITV